LERPALADAAQDELIQRRRLGDGRPLGDAEKGVGELEGRAGRRGRYVSGEVGLDRKLIAHAIDRDAPRPGPDRAAIERVLAAIDEEERDEELRRSAIGFDFDVLAVLDLAGVDRERVVVDRSELLPRRPFTHLTLAEPIASCQPTMPDT